MMANATVQIVEVAAVAVVGLAIFDHFAGGGSTSIPNVGTQIGTQVGTQIGKAAAQAANIAAKSGIAAASSFLRGLGFETIVVGGTALLVLFRGRKIFTLIQQGTKWAIKWASNNSKPPSSGGSAPAVTTPTPPVVSTASSTSTSNTSTSNTSTTRTKTTAATATSPITTSTQFTAAFYLDPILARIKSTGQITAADAGAVYRYLQAHVVSVAAVIGTFGLAGVTAMIGQYPLLAGVLAL